MTKAQTAPFAVARLSRRFLDAALAVQDPAKTAAEELAQPISLVAYYLAGHSIELCFKAFLLGRGLSVATLRNRKKFGHNLSTLLAESRRRKLGTCVKLSAKEVAIVHGLNDCYEGKELEYAFHGTRRLPHYLAVVQLATRLHEGIAPYCDKLALNRQKNRE